MFLSDLSIKRPIMISMILIVFLVFGGMAYFSLNLDLIPSVDIAVVTVQTIYLGAGPQEVETQVTDKIEEAISTISNIDYIRSYSMDSVSIVIINFKMGKDADIANQEVKDKIDAIINDLPEDTESPLVSKMDLKAEPVIDLVLSGKIDILQLYEIADKQLRERFSQIPGVARVSLVGGQKREIHVELENRTVFENAISLPQLVQILKSQNIDMPGGRFNQQGQEYSVRLNGEIESLEILSDVEIPTKFGMKKLKELANIRDTGEEVRERTTFLNHITHNKNDHVVLLSISKSADGNTVDMAEQIKKELTKIEQELPMGCRLTLVMDKSIFIESAVEDTLGNILIGIVLTSLVLLFFLHDIRSTIIVALSMPFSIISTFLLMQVSGFTLNIMTLMGLSTSVGILVANSVVVLENIFRFKAKGVGKKEAAAKGTSEMMVAVFASTLTNIAVFLPIASMSSLAGQFFKEFALTVTFATLFSLLVSFTLTPMMASLILPEKNNKKHPIGNVLEKFIRLLEQWYLASLRVVIINRWRSLAVVLIAILIFLLSLSSASRIGFEFMPILDEGDINIEVELPQGYNLEETAQLLNTVENRLKQNPEVKHVMIQLGRISETDIGTNLAKVSIKLKDASQRDIKSSEAASKFTRQLSDIPNARFMVAAVSSVGTKDAPLKFFLQGANQKTLESIKDGLLSQIKDIPGLVNLGTSSRTGKPEITINPDRRKLDEARLSIYDLALTLRLAVEGIVATKYKKDNEEYDIRIMLDKNSVNTPEKIGNISLSSPDGVHRLNQLAQVNFTEGFSKILHKDKIKAIEFSGHVAPGYALGDIVTQIRTAIADMKLPNDYRVAWSGDVELMEDTAVDMITTFIIAILLTYMLLAAILENLTQPLIILGTVPLAMIGVFWGLDLTGKTMNLMSMMAIVMLLGVVVNNAILLLDYTNQLRTKGKTLTEALLEACPTKLKPILMSTIAIMLGMLPMAMGIGAAGREFRQPLGIVSIGGLFISAIMTLFVIPAISNLTLMKKKSPKNNGIKNITIVFTIIGLALAGNYLHAKTYDWESFLHLVEKNNKDLKLARVDLDMAKVYKKEALSTALPKIHIEANYYRNLKENYLFIDFPDSETGEINNQKFKINYKNEFDMSTVISQPLFSFKVGAALKAAKQFQKLTGYVYNAKHRAITNVARKAFFQALLLQKVWDVTKASEKNARDNYLQIKKHFEHGQVSKLKLLQAENRWQETIPKTLQTERNFRLAINNLKTLAGIPETEKFILKGDFTFLPEMPKRETIETILEKRPDYMALVWEEHLRDTGVKSEKANLLPSLDLNLIYGFNSMSDKFRFERQNHSYIMGLKLSIPVFAGGYNRTQVTKARIEQKKVRLKIDKERNSIYNEIQNIFLRLGEANQRIQAARKTLETAKQAFTIAEVAANNGLATQLELKDARVSYDQARVNTYAAIYDYMAAYFDWELASGKTHPIEN